MITRIVNSLRGQWIGIVALFVALGGTGYAAVSIPRHSVGRRQLKHGAVGQRQLAKHSVGAKQLRRHAVTQRAIKSASVGSRQLRKGSVRGNQLAPGSVSASKLAAGSVGTSQIAAGAVGNGQLAAGSVAPGNLTGFGGYTLAFAVVGPTGTGAGSPGATFTGYNGAGSWSNGNGEVHFQTGLGTNTCLAFSSAPQGNSDGTSTNTSAAIVPTSPSETTVRVITQVVGNSAPALAVWIECVA